MPDALVGSLVDLRPRTLLHFLGLTGKSGELRVGEATVRLRHGRVVGDAVDAVVAMLRLPQGAFAFEECMVEADGDGASVDAVLEAASELLADWEEVAAVVPSSAVVVSLRAGEGEARLSADAWAVSVAVAAGHVTPARLGLHLAWPPLRVGRAIKELLECDRAELAAPPRRRQAVAGAALWPGQDAEAWRTPWYDPGQ